MKEGNTATLEPTVLETLTRLPPELERFTSLQSLNLSGCSQLSGDLSPLASLTSLQLLNLSLCERLSGDLSSLASLTSLQSLNLESYSRLKGDLSSLAGLTSLQSLYLYYCNHLSGDLSPLASLTSLQELDISYCDQLSGDLSPLAGLISLQSLDLAGCGFRRFAPLESLLPTLKELYLFDCKFEDLPTEVCGENDVANVLNEVRAHYRQRRTDASPKIAPPQRLGTPPPVFISYAWGDISLNASAEDRQRQEVVERLCGKLEQESWNLIRDKGALDNGDQISAFMKTLGQARLVIVVLSEKYLRSPYCMTELYSVYQNARQERQEFLNRIIPLVLKDANIGNWRARVSYAEHWETEFKAMEQHFTHLGEEDLKLYKAMRRWHNEVGDMLAYVNDVLSPHGFEDIVKDDFVGLRQMLERHR